MISVEELFKGDKYPRWITSNQVFRKLDYIRKVFPSIGLDNFEETIVIDNSKEISTFAKQLMSVMADCLDDRRAKLDLFAKKAKIGKKRRHTLTVLLSSMNRLAQLLRHNQEQFITVAANGKVTLGTPEDLSYENEVFIKKGMGLFRVWEKISTTLKENKFLELSDLAQTYQFKNFSSINLPSKEITVKFSSDGENGIWDIATMSMRGVNSCQTWDQGVGNSVKVIGSIIDPFTGIIYLTNKAPFNTYGSKMLRRCIVRYVIDGTSKTPFLLLEKMYPAFDKPSLDTFVNALRKRIPNIPIFHSSELGDKAVNAGTKLSQSYIPLSDELKMLDNKCYPYTDSALIFKEDINCKLAKNTAALKLSFKKRVPELFQKAIQSRAFTKEKVKKYGSAATDIMSALRVKVGDKTNNENKSDELVKNPTTEGLSKKFANFVCELSDDDPFHYLAEHEDQCTQFFVSEFGDKTNKDFAKFIASNVFNYIDEKLK